MAIKIVQADIVGITVKGTINDEAGIPQPFDFKLKCTRLDEDTIQAKLKGNTEESMTDFMASVVLDWTGVKDADNKPVPYGEDTLRQLCKLSGVSRVAFNTYLFEVGAKAKN